VAQQAIVNHIHASGGARNRSKQVDADPCLRHACHWDRRKCLTVTRTFVYTLNVLFKIALKIARLLKNTLNLAIKQALQSYLHLMYETFFFPVDFNNLTEDARRKLMYVLLLSDLSEI